MPHEIHFPRARDSSNGDAIAKTRERTTKGMVLALVLFFASAISAFSAPAGEATEAPAVAVEQQKRLAIFLDGTWNAVDSNTNVWRARALCAPTSRDGKRQLIYYEIGVNGFYGGVFGKGLSENIRLAYEWLIENYNDGMRFLSSVLAAGPIPLAVSQA